MYICIYICIYMHTHIHTYIYMYIYCRTYNVRVCSYIAYIACGSTSLYKKRCIFSVLWRCQRRLPSLT